MKKICFILLVILFFKIQLNAQQLVFSEVDKKDKVSMSFNVIGKFQNQKLLIFKNNRAKNKISMYDVQMNRINDVDLDFLPEKLINIDFINYSNYFYAVYQYQEKNIVYCRYIKLNEDGKRISNPILIDSSEIDFFGQNKIYTTIVNENKSNIAVFKFYKYKNSYTIAINIFDSGFQQQNKHQQKLSVNENRDLYSNFVIDNEGDFFCTKDTRDKSNKVSESVIILTLKKGANSFFESPVNLNNKLVDNVILKIDNLNKRCILNSFYQKSSKSKIEGIFTYIYEKDFNKKDIATFTEISDTLKSAMKKTVSIRNAFDNVFLNQIEISPLGNFTVLAEYFSSTVFGGVDVRNRWEYLNNIFFSKINYFYNPLYGFYQPSNNTQIQNTRYAYENVLVLHFTNEGKLTKANVLAKNQYDDGSEMFLSFGSMQHNNQLHIFFNDDKYYNSLKDNTIAYDSYTKIGLLKTEEKRYFFMPRYAKPISNTELILPFEYKGNIGFASLLYQ